MDFNLNDEEQAIHDLTAQILGDKSTHERLRQLAADDDRIDSEAWAALAEAGVLGAAIPEAHGGVGLGYLASAMALQQVGATASPVPLLSTVVMGAMPIAEFGTDAQQAAHLPSHRRRVVDRRRPGSTRKAPSRRSRRRSPSPTATATGSRVSSRWSRPVSTPVSS